MAKLDWTKARPTGRTSLLATGGSDTSYSEEKALNAWVDSKRPAAYDWKARQRAKKAAKKAKKKAVNT